MSKIRSDAPSLRESDAPWVNEPDEWRWTDEATGYTCMALRGPTGAWCGYVAPPPNHPAANRQYDYYSTVPVEDVASGAVSQADAQIMQAMNDIQVHGGLTYAGKRDEASDAWWFGFDCAHAGDFSPKYDRLNDPILGLGRPTGWGGVITYRTLEYVQEQCSALARQLHAIASESNRKDGSSPKIPQDPTHGR